MNWLTYLWPFTKPKPSCYWQMRIVRWGICTIEGHSVIESLQMTRGDHMLMVPLTRWGKYLAGSGFN